MKIRLSNGWKTLYHGGLWSLRIYGNWYSVEDKVLDDCNKLQTISWPSIYQGLDNQGYSVIDRLLPPHLCQSLAEYYDNDQLFRSQVTMARHGFGSGEYRYFQYPLPDVIAQLRRALYVPLVDIANRWQCAMRLAPHFPAIHDDFIAHCHQAGQCKPTPLILRYGLNDYNCLHQDLYGDWIFPLQVVILLSEPNVDFTGGEFILTEQRPRMQSRAEVVPLKQGDACIFAVYYRPVQGSRGYYRVNMRHGVSRIRSGQRHTLGIIFHDAK